MNQVWHIGEAQEKSNERLHDGFATSPFIAARRGKTGESGIENGAVPTVVENPNSTGAKSGRLSFKESALYFCPL